MSLDNLLGALDSYLITTKKELEYVYYTKPYITFDDELLHIFGEVISPTVKHNEDKIKIIEHCYFNLIKQVFEYKANQALGKYPHTLSRSFSYEGSLIHFEYVAETVPFNLLADYTDNVLKYLKQKPILLVMYDDGTATNLNNYYQLNWEVYCGDQIFEFIKKETEFDLKDYLESNNAVYRYSSKL